jgi:hypothetical protein
MFGPLRSTTMMNAPIMLPESCRRAHISRRAANDGGRMALVLVHMTPLSFGWTVTRRDIKTMPARTGQRT